MAAAVILIWGCCLWSITRSVLSLLLAANPWRRLLVLAVLLLAVSCAHKPIPRIKQNAPIFQDENDKNDK